VDNVRTWKFARHNPATFFVTFRYKLNSGNTDVEFLEAPGVVRIEAEPSQLSILYADIDLGTWKIEWKSRLGTSHRTVELFYNGADEEWLEGKFLDPRRAVKKDDDDEDEKSDNDSEKIDYGHREADFVAFKVKLHSPDVRQISTFFVGHIKANKIIGTFVDDSGLTGTWTATRIPDKTKAR
jgi:hypothetical protein